MAQIKDALAGRYELRHIIGRGGMGVRGARRPRANGPKLRRRLAVALGVAVLLVAGGLALSLSGSRRTDARAPGCHHPPQGTHEPARFHAPTRSLAPIGCATALGLEQRP